MSQNHIDFPQPFRGITTFKFNTHRIALVRYPRSLVVRALHRHRKGVGSIPGEGPITA